MAQLPPGIAGFELGRQADQRAQQGPIQLIGILSQLQARQEEQAQARDTAPIRRGILEGQLAKIQADVELQRQATSSLNAGGPLTSATPDQLEALGTRLSLAGHPGGAGMIATAERMRQSQGQNAAKAQFNQEIAKPTEAGALSQFGFRMNPAGQPEPIPGVPQLAASEDQPGHVPMSVAAQNPARVLASGIEAKVPGQVLSQLMPKSVAQQTGFTLAPGATRYDTQGNVVASAPAAPPRMVGRNQPGGTQTPGDFTKTGDEFLASLPESERVLVKKVANYEADPKSLSVQGGHREQIMRQAAQYNPDFDQKNYPAIAQAVNKFATGPQGNTVKSLNVAIEHMDTARRMGDALENSDIPLFNRVANEFAVQTGKPAPTNFNAVKEVVANEIVKGTIGGAGALQDREETAKKIRDASSPAQMKGVFDSWTELLAGQLKGMEQQYSGATGRKDFREKYLTPRALEALGGVTAPVGGADGWVKRAMEANPDLSLAEVLANGKRLKKIPENYQYGIR